MPPHRSASRPSSSTRSSPTSPTPTTSASSRALRSSSTRSCSQDSGHAGAFRPSLGGQVLSVLEGQLDEWCTARKMRGEQMEELGVLVKDPGWTVDVHAAYIPLQRILRQLPSLTSLALDLTRAVRRGRALVARCRRYRHAAPSFEDGDFHAAHGGDSPRGDNAPEYAVRGVAVRAGEHRAFRVPHQAPSRAAVPAQRLRESAQAADLVGQYQDGEGDEGPAGYLKVMIPWSWEVEVAHLPPALNNVTVLAREARDLHLAALLPKLERLDVAFEGSDLSRLFADLRRNGTSRKGNFQHLRRLRARGLCVTREEEGDGVGHVFRELEGLESLEVLRDDLTCVRYARDGATQVVRWTCEESEVWYHDWEEDVTLEDPEWPLCFLSQPTISLAAAAAAAGGLLEMPL